MNALSKQSVFQNPDDDPRVAVFNAMSQLINTSNNRIEMLRLVNDKIPKLKPNSKKHRSALAELAALMAERNS